MNKFAFVSHYLDTQLVSELVTLPLIANLPRQHLKWLVRMLPPHQYMRFHPMNSINGQQASGIGILCPLLPEHFVTLSPMTVLKKIVSAAKIGERFGAKIIGLGGFTSVFGNEGEEVAKYLTASITSGNTYTAVLATQGIIRAAELLGLNLEECRLAVIGATGDIGSACTRLLSKKVRETILVARDENRMCQLASELVQNGRKKVVVMKRTSEAVKNADLILCVASAITTLIEESYLKTGAIVCDVGYPANVAHNIMAHRNDIFIFEGGLATWSGYEQLGDKKKIQKFSPPGTVHGCLAETMLLALEGKFVNFSIGRGNITGEKMREISAIADKHGFKLAPFLYGSTHYSIEQVKQIGHCAASNRKNRTIFSV